MLPSENDTPEIKAEIAAAFAELIPNHERPQFNFEHGHWWATCLDCGGQWSVVDTDTGFDFEEITDNDGYCE